VGALRALAEVLGPGPLPFDIIAGLSAGAINSLVISTGADDFGRVTQRLRATWESLTPDRVYQTGTLRLASIGSRWIRDLSAGGLIGKSGINYLLDPTPLRRLLESEVPIGRMRRHLRSGRLRAVAVSATNYHTGAGITFYEGASDIEPWLRSTRIGTRARITLDHVMASAAIPVFFPPIRIGRTFYGDGCVRMIYPMSPAIHLGADRILAISVRYLRPPGETLQHEAKDKDDILPLSEIAGVLLNAVFLDSLDSDLERLERINKTIALIPRDKLNHSDVDMRPVPRSSSARRRISQARRRRVRALPAMLRYLLKGIGATGHAGEDLLSYLAFEPIYLKRVMDLGHADTLARREEIEEFFLGAPQPQRERARG
jgi:NTE family protein